MVVELDFYDYLPPVSEELSAKSTFLVFVFGSQVAPVEKDSSASALYLVPTVRVLVP